MPQRQKRTVRPRGGKKRMAFTIQLHPEKDAEIIEYLNQQENKQAAIREALRACISAQPPPEMYTDDIQILIKDLRAHMDQRFAETQRLIKSAPARTEPPPPIERDEGPVLDNGMRKALIKGFKPGS